MLMLGTFLNSTCITQILVNSSFLLLLLRCTDNEFFPSLKRKFVLSDTVLF